jgi:hypothetical protein
MCSAVDHVPKNNNFEIILCVKVASPLDFVINNLEEASGKKGTEKVILIAMSVSNHVECGGNLVALFVGWTRTVAARGQAVTSKRIATCHTFGTSCHDVPAILAPEQAKLPGARRGNRPTRATNAARASGMAHTKYSREKRRNDRRE